MPTAITKTKITTFFYPFCIFVLSTSMFTLKVAPPLSLLILSFTHFLKMAKTDLPNQIKEKEEKACSKSCGKIQKSSWR
jgi:hypothetical protein